MNRQDLNDFLRELALFERSAQNGNGNALTASLLDGVSTDELMAKKFPTLKRSAMYKLSERPQLSEKKVITFPGDGIIFSCHPRFVNNREHRHSYIEMIFVYSGECRQTINSRHITMKTGEICILDTNVLHSIDPAGEKDIIINCMMSKNYLDNILLDRLSGNDLLSSFFIRAIYQSNEFNDYILFHSGTSEKIRELVADALCEYFDPALCSAEVINCHMVLVFSELLRIYTHQTNSENYKALENTKVSDIIQYVQNNCKTTTLTATAEHFHFHPSYLSTIVKKLTGRNFTDILHEAKIKKACLLLKNSEVSVVKIANELGYENINFFYRLFKKHCGITPARYRKE